MTDPEVRPNVCSHIDQGPCGHHLSRSTRGAIAAIRWYQRAFAHRLSPCRFFPSCSNYALEAYELHGAVRGSWLTARRLLRCRPFGPSGIDLVPAPQTEPRTQPVTTQPVTTQKVTTP